MMKSQFSYIEQGDPVPLEQLGQNIADPGVDDSYLGYLDNCFTGLIQVSRHDTDNILNIFDITSCHTMNR